MPEFSPLTGVTTTGRPFSVFLSHSMRDTEHVEVVQRHLEALGISAWLAELDPRPGGSVLQKIESVLPKSDAIVFLITTNSIDSAYVHQEIGLARAHSVPMVPLVDHRVDKSRLGLLAELEWIGIELAAASRSAGRSNEKSAGTGASPGTATGPRVEPDVGPVRLWRDRVRPNRRAPSAGSRRRHRPSA